MEEGMEEEWKRNGRRMEEGMEAEWRKTDGWMGGWLATLAEVL
jgi:hypothetical protein